MSRTDAHAPHWVAAEWWEPWHSRCHRAPYYPGDRECDLPDEPVLRHPDKHRLYACVWKPSWQGSWDWYGRGAPTWYVRLEFTGPDRARVRDELVRARQEYRATGDVDTVASTTQHRHQARWDWW